MDAREFREAGYLMELNRRFLHPLGLALETVRAADGSEQFGAIHDGRDDPEGYIFADSFFELDDAANADRIQREWHDKADARLKRFGWILQPIPGHVDDGSTVVRD
jgi:hypothetical protein